MAFATATDVATRLGRDLTADETAQATAVIATVEGLIADAVHRTAADIAAITPFPATLTALCVEKAVAVIANPQGVESSTEELGAYRFSATYSDPAAAVFLTDAEQRRARRAITGSFHALSLASPYSGEAATDYPELPLS